MSIITFIKRLSTSKSQPTKTPEIKHNNDIMFHINMAEACLNHIQEKSEKSIPKDRLEWEGDSDRLSLGHVKEGELQVKLTSNQYYNAISKAVDMIELPENLNLKLLPENINNTKNLIKSIEDYKASLDPVELDSLNAMIIKVTRYVRHSNPSPENLNRGVGN